MDVLAVELLRGRGMVEPKGSVQLQGKEREVHPVALGDSWTRTCSTSLRTKHGDAAPWEAKDRDRDHMAALCCEGQCIL